MGFFSSIAKDLKRGLKKVVSWLTGVKDFDVNDFNNGALVNKQSNIEPLPIVYGERKVGGTRVFVATSGTGNQYLYVVLALCEGEVNQLGTVWINEIESTDSRFTGKVTINKYVGTDAQTADSMLTAASIGWTSDHRLRGVAYLAMRFTYDQDTFGGGIPNVNCLVQGRKVYDTRTATTVYSKNPAVCLRDYLTNTRYGKGLSSSVIDDASFEDAADKCDTLVTKYTASSTGPIFTCNAIIDTANTAFDNVKVFLSGMRGLMPFNNGVYSLIIEDVYSSTFDFTEDNIKSDINVESAPKSQQYNRVAAKFINPLTNWQMDSVTWPEAGSSDYTNFLAADNSIELSTEINLPSTTDYYAARDIARIVCLESRLCKLSVSIVATSEALVCAIGDIVTLTHASMGWSSKLFMVAGLELYDDGEVGVQLREHSASIYPWIVDAVQPTTYSSTLPNPLVVQPPTSFVITETTYLASDGTVVPEIVVTWTASADAFVEQYEVQYKLTTDSNYFSEFVNQPRIVAGYAEVGKTYNIQVRAINGLGVRSAFLATTYTITGDVTAPSTPTGLTIVGSYNEAVAKWDASAAKDYKETILYASLTNDFSTATEQARVSGTTVTYYNLPLNTTYYAWLKNADFSGNMSAASAAVSFTTTTGITTSQLADGSVTEAKIGSVAVTAGKIGTNAVTSAKINASAVTEAKIGTGAVTVNKIGAGAVTNAKLAADAVAANVFAASVQPLGIAATVPLTRTVDTIFVTADAKLYRWNGTAYIKTVDDGDITGMTVSKLTAGTINAAITTTNILQLSTDGKIYTAGKTSAASTTAGVFMGHDGASSYDFAVGDATNSIVYDGSAGTFTITGEVVVLGSLKADSTKTFDGSNFMYELGTATTIAGYSGASILRTQKTTSFALGAIASGSDTFALAGQSTNSAGAGYGGAFVNSTTAGGTSHRTETYLTNSSNSGIFLHTSSTNQAILGNATYAGNFTGNVNVTGDITATGTITPFTGSHDGVLDDVIEPELGDILVDVSVIAKESVNDTLTRMDLSSAANQCAIGVYSGNRQDTYLPLAISEPGTPIVVTPYTSIPGDRVLKPDYAHLLDESRIIACNSVGEGQINVCGENGNIAAGDLIVTSSIAGKGMKQSDDIIRAKTVSKAREAVTFTDPTQVKMIACIYLCG